MIIGQAKSMITDPSLAKKLGTSTAGFVGWSVGDGELNLAVSADANERGLSGIDLLGEP